MVYTAWASENIFDFYDEIIKTEQFFAGKDVGLSLLFVNDGSTDDTEAKIKELAQKDDRVHYVAFSRNFGKEAAIYAGLKESDGDYTVFIDADLQDPPSLLPEMLGAILDEGYDSAATRRVTRKGEPPIRSFFARCFYRIINKMSNTEIVDGARDYRIMTKKMADSILSMKEYNRFTKGIYGWIGFRTKWLEFENVERRKGETKWSFWKLFLYALDGIIAFSTAPLSIASFMGVLFCILSLVLIIVTIIRKLVFGDPTSGWPSLVCIISLVSGIQLFCLGILGQYLSKAYLEVKNRPIYILREEI